MKRSVAVFVLILMLMLIIAFALSGCAYFQTVQKKWNTMTPDEQARVVIAGLQEQLDTKFDEAKLFITGKPELQEFWKKNLVPAFDTCNRSLLKMKDLAQAGKMAPDQVYITFKPKLDQLILYLVKLGMKWSWEGDVLKFIQSV